MKLFWLNIFSLLCMLRFTLIPASLVCKVVNKACFPFLILKSSCVNYHQHHFLTRFWMLSAEATPKAIMRTMNVKGLTLFHLKSHLQVSLILLIILCPIFSFVTKVKPFFLHCRNTGLVSNLGRMWVKDAKMVWLSFLSVDQLCSHPCHLSICSVQCVLWCLSLFPFHRAGVHLEF